MKTRTYTIAPAFALALAAAPAAWADDARTQAEPMQPSRAAQALMGDDAKDFFETAASANQFEIESSKLALERATDPALKSYAQKMVKDHEKAGEDLKALARKKDTIVPASLLRRHQAMLDDLRNEQPGKAFDDEYRDKMVLSHKEAVSLFDEAARDSRDPEIKAFAAKMLPTLQAHGGAAKALPKPRG